MHAGVGGPDHHVRRQRVHARVDEDRVAGFQGIRREQRPERLHGIAGRGAGVPVVADRRGVLVADERAVVDEIGVPRGRRGADREDVVGGVLNTRSQRVRDADPGPQRAIGLPRIPREVTVIRLRGRDGGVRRAVVETDRNVDEIAGAQAAPRDDHLAIGPELLQTIGREQLDQLRRRARRLSGVAVEAEVDPAAVLRGERTRQPRRMILGDEVGQVAGVDGRRVDGVRAPRATVIARDPRRQVEVVVLARAPRVGLVSQHLVPGRHPRRPRLRRLVRPDRPPRRVVRRAPLQHRPRRKRPHVHRLVPQTHPPPRRRVVEHPAPLHVRRRREVVDQRRAQALDEQPLRPGRVDGERVVPHRAQVDLSAPPQRLVVVRQPAEPPEDAREAHHPVDRRRRRCPRERPVREPVEPQPTELLEAPDPVRPVHVHEPRIRRQRVRVEPQLVPPVRQRRERVLPEPQLRPARGDAAQLNAIDLLPRAQVVVRVGRDPHRLDLVGRWREGDVEVGGSTGQAGIGAVEDGMERVGHVEQLHLGDESVTPRLTDGHAGGRHGRAVAERDELDRSVPRRRRPGRGVVPVGRYVRRAEGLRGGKRGRAELAAEVDNGARVLREQERGGRGGEQVVEVAGEAPLRRVGHAQRHVPQSPRPQDVVLQLHVLARPRHLHRVRRQLHHRVVRQRQRAARCQHVVHPDPARPAVVHQVVGHRVRPEEHRQVDPCPVVVHRVAQHHDVPGPHPHPVPAVAVHPRVPQRAAADPHPRRVPPARHVVHHHAEAAPYREPRCVVVRLVREVLSRRLQLEPRRVAVRHVAVRLSRQIRRRVLEVEPPPVVPRHVARHVEARRDHHQPRVRVVVERVVPHHHVGAHVFQIHPDLLPPVRVVGLVAQHRRVLPPREHPVVLVPVPRVVARVPVEHVVPDHRPARRRVHDVQPGVRVLEHPCALQREARRAGAHVDPVEAPGDRQGRQRHRVRVAQLERVAARRPVAPVQHRLVPRSHRPLDVHAGIRMADDDVGRQGVRPRVHEDRVAELEVVGLQDRPDRGLRGGRREPVVGVVAGRRCVLAVGRRGVVDVEVGNRRNDTEHRLRLTEDRRRSDRADPDHVLVRRREQGGVDEPAERPVVELIVGEQLEGPDRARAGEVNPHVAREAVGAPADVERGLLRQPLASVGIRHQDVLGRALGRLGRIAVGAEVDEPAVVLRLVGERVTGTPAVDGGTLRGIGGERSLRRRRTGDGRRGRRRLEAAVERLLVEVVVLAVSHDRRGRQVARQDHLPPSGRQRRRPLESGLRLTAVVRHLVGDRHEAGGRRREHAALLGTRRRGAEVVDEQLSADRQPLWAERVDEEGVVAGSVESDEPFPASRPVVVAEPRRRYAEEGGEVHLAVDPRGHRGTGERPASVERRRQALGDRRAQNAVGAVGIDEERVDAQAVAIAEIGELPGLERRAIALPEPDFPAGGCQQEVEVALEVPLAVVRDEDPVSRLGPDDVVPEMDVVGVRGADAVGRGLEDRVVDDLVRRGLR